MKHAFGSGKNVVSLFRRADEVTYPAVAQVEAYWEALRGGRMMPERAEIDPRGLESALEFAFILEHIAPGVGRIRVAGMHMSDILGMEVRGMPLTALFAPECRDLLSQALQSVVSEPKVAHVALTAPGGIGRPALKAQLYLAPLASQTGSVPRVLGCLQAVGEIGRAPRRFTVERVQLRRIASSTARPTGAGGSQAQSAFAEDPAPFRPAEDISDRPRPRLRLVKSDE